MNNDNKHGNDGNEKFYKTQDDLLNDIQTEEPDFKADNVYDIRQNDLTNYPIINFNDMKKDKPKPVELVMTPIIPTQGIIFVYAATGVGKTFFTLNIAYAISRGGSFLKYHCEKPLRILYVDGEMAYNQLHARIMSIVEQQGDSEFPENFMLLTPDKCLFPIPQLDNQNGQALYRKMIDENKIDVIIFDNLSTLASFDENKSHEWKPIQDFLVRLRAAGKTMIIVHHAGKDKNGYRGTSRMLDVADLGISLQPQNDDGLVEQNASLKKFKIVYQKPRHLVGDQAMSYEVIFENGAWSYQSLEISTMDRAIECYKANMSQRDIATELKISQSSVHRLINKAKLQKKLPN